MKSVLARPSIRTGTHKWGQEITNASCKGHLQGKDGSLVATSTPHDVGNGQSQAMCPVGTGRLQPSEAEKGRAVRHLRQRVGWHNPK